MSKPSSWRQMTVASVCKKVSVGIVVQPAQYYTKEDSGVRAFRSTNIGEGRVNDRDWVYISTDGHKKNKKSELRTGDVLVIRSGAPGTSCVVTKGFAGTNCIDLVFARPRTDIILPEFLCLFTNSEIGKKQITATQGGLALKHFNVGAYKKMNINVPDISEQTTITDLLSIWDQAIEKTERLIVTKEKLFLWLSGSCLFGGNRPNAKASKKTKWFSVPDHWEIVKIGSIAKEVTDTNNAGENIPVLSCTKYDGLVDSLTYFDKQVFSKDTSNYKVVSSGQFAYATNHVEEGSIGYQNVYGKGLVSPMYTVFKTDSIIDDGYLYKVLKTKTYKHIFRVSTSASVDRRGSLRWKEFAKLPIPLPPADEQQKITRDLSTVRKEIDLLKKLLEAYRKQRRGLMQKLLTDQWRVKTM